MSSAIFIPCHLNSIRFPNKILTKINNLEMVEHVRRRALLTKIKNVFIVTNSKKISSIVSKFGGDYFISKKNHSDGSSRVNEISESSNFKKIILLQGDEPLILPSYLNKLNETKIDLSNTVLNLATICKPKDIYDLDVVKCLATKNNFVRYLFRDPNEIKNISNKKVFKIMGTILYPSHLLSDICNYPPILTISDQNKSIEQIKILRKGYKLKLVLVNKSTQSINTKKDKNQVLKILENSTLQRKIFSKIV